MLWTKGCFKSSEAWLVRFQYSCYSNLDVAARCACKLLSYEGKHWGKPVRSFEIMLHRQSVIRYKCKKGVFLPSHCSSLDCLDFCQSNNFWYQLVDCYKAMWISCAVNLFALVESQKTLEHSSKAWECHQWHREKLHVKNKAAPYYYYFHPLSDA